MTMLTTLPPAPPVWVKEWTHEDEVKRRIEWALYAALQQVTVDPEGLSYNDSTFVDVAWRLLMSDEHWIENLLTLAHEGFRRVAFNVCDDDEDEPAEPTDAEAAALVRVELECMAQIKAALAEYAKRHAAESPEPRADG
jgi:hypothetical protein